MELSKNESPALPSDYWGIIFKSGNCDVKRSLECVSKGFTVYSQQLFEKMSVYDFVDILYQANPWKDLSWIDIKCNNENKNLLINYFLISGAQPEKDARDPRGQWIREGIDKKDVLNKCLEVKKFDVVFQYIVNNNIEKHVKYYIDYSNAQQCTRLLMLDLIKIQGFQNEWSGGKTLEQWIEECKSMKQIVCDICSFFDKETSCTNFVDIFHEVICEKNSKEQVGKYIIKALNVKNFSMLVFLRTSGRHKTIENAVQWQNSFFDNAQTDNQRKLLAKACYANNINRQFVIAVENGNREKTKSYLEILIDQGYDFNHENNKIENLLKNIFAINLSEMLPALFEAGFNAKISDINDLTADQIKKCVKVGYGLYGEDFWIKGDNYYFLYQAVFLKDAELVEYLLNHKADANRKRCDNKQPIFYALDEDDIFTLLLPKTNLSIQDLGQNINIKLFKNYPEIKESNVLQLIKKCLDPSKIAVSDNSIIENMYRVMIAAIVLSKNEIVKYLLEVITWPDNDKRKMLKFAIDSKNISIVSLLLTKNAHKNGISFDKSYWNCQSDQEKELLFLLAGAGVNFFDIEMTWSLILSLMNQGADIIHYYDTHKKNITEEQSQKFLSYVIQQERYDVVKHLLNNEVKQTNTKISSNSIVRNGVTHTFYEIDGDYNKIKNQELKLLLFKDLVVQNKNDNAVLRYLLDYAIEKQNVDMVKAVLVHYKNINNFEYQILGNWTEQKKEIMELLIERGFNIIHLIDGDRRSIARAWLNVLDTETLIKSLKIGEGVITSPQALLLLEDVLFLYRDIILLNQLTEAVESALKIKALFDFIISLKKINIFDVLCGSVLSLDKLSFLKLIDDQVIIDYISFKADITVNQLQKLLNEAVSSNRCDVVSYLFKEKKVPLRMVNGLYSKNENMQQVLKSYQEELEQQETLYQEGIDEHVKNIKNNKIDNISPINRPVSESLGGIFLLSEDEKKAYDSIIFLADQLLNNPQNTYLRNKIQEINIAWIDNIYTRCSNGITIMKAMEVLSIINDNLRELTDEEKIARNNLRKIIMDGQGFQVIECKKYLENIYSVYNRHVADEQIQKEMLFALEKQIRKSIKQVNQGVDFNCIGEIFIKKIDLLPTSNSAEENAFFKVLEVFIKVNNANKGIYSNNHNVYLEKKHNYIKEIQQKKTENLAAKNGDTIINNQNSFFGLGTIKNIVFSFFTTIFSILQWLNPFKLIFG